MFCEVLKSLRIGRKIKQSEIAEYLNVTQGAIANWEKGIRSPGLDLIPRIAEFYDVSINYLFEVETPPQVILSPDESQLLAAYRAAPPSIQQFTLNALTPYLTDKKAARA